MGRYLNLIGGLGLSVLTLFGCKDNSEQTKALSQIKFYDYQSVSASDTVSKDTFDKPREYERYGTTAKWEAGTLRIEGDLRYFEAFTKLANTFEFDVTPVVANGNIVVGIRDINIGWDWNVARFDCRSLSLGQAYHVRGELDGDKFKVTLSSRDNVVQMAYSQASHLHALDVRGEGATFRLDNLAAYKNAPASEEQVRAVRTAESQLTEIWNNSRFSREQKVNYTNDIRRSLNQEIALQLIRIFPVQDPDTKQVVPLDAYLRAMTVSQAPELKGTRLYCDPVGTAFDLLMGNYNPMDFVRDHISTARIARNYYPDYGIRSSGGIPTSDRGNVRYDPKTGGYIDKDGNLLNPSVIEQQNREYNRLTNQGAHKDASGTWVISESEIRRQAEEEQKKKKK